MQPLRAAVVVVGAGPSGLACADALTAHLGSGAGGVLVLEAAPRVGGRTRSVALASAPDVRVDLGGQWLGSRQSALRALAAELGLETHVQHCAGRRVLDLGRVVSTYAGLIPSASPAVLVDAQLTLWLLALLQLLLRCADACSTCFCCGRRSGGGALARALDAVSVEQLARRCMWTAGGRALVTVVVLGLFGREPAELSALALCRYASASGGLEEMSESGPGSVQERTFIGGAQQVSELLSARAEARGARLLLGHAVVAIERGGSEGVLVTCANGTCVRCNRVVMAVPPPVAQAIAFTPSLSAERAALMRDATMGGIIKVLVVYRTAFWRDKGFSGEVICDTNADPANLPVFNIFDGCTPRPGGDGLVPMLTCFVNGARARELSVWSASERRRVILAQLARYFGDEALEPVELLEHDWVADPFTRGCPIASYGRAVLSGYGVARRLHDQEPAWGDLLLWAGTETAEVSTGFIDGAVRAGLRAADAAVEAEGRKGAVGATSAGALPYAVGASGNGATPTTAVAAARGASGGSGGGGGSSGSGGGTAAKRSVAAPLALPLLAPQLTISLLFALLLALLAPAPAGGILVGGVVVPHGDFAILPSLLAPGTANYSLAQALHDAAVGPATDAIIAARPDVVLLIAPHAIALTTDFAIYESSLLAGAAAVGGDLHNSSTPLVPFFAAAAGAPAFATALAANLSASAAGANVSGLLAFGDAVPGQLQWSEVIPLSLLSAALNGSSPSPSSTSLSSSRPGLVVWAQPQRRLVCASCMVPELLALGGALAAFADDSVQRVLLLVSADLSHVHPAGVNPYPPNGAVAAAFDAAVGEWAAALDRDKLIVEAAALADDALSCGFTGMVLLEAALRASRGAPWAPRLLSGPSAPTYYGMVVAVFEATGAGT